MYSNKVTRLGKLDVHSTRKSQGVTSAVDLDKSVWTRP